MDFTLINKASKYLQPISNQLIWRINTQNKEVFLTFDDGPHPEITPWVLAQLKQFNAKATFFLVGQNAERYPEVVKQITSQGHHIGNHTFNHLKGWNTKNFTYFKNTLQCEKYFESTLFRPPHGQITPDQHRVLSKKHRIIMWSFLTRDYNKSVSPQYIVNSVTDNTQAGEVIVFHDSEKAAANLMASLPAILKNLTRNGFTFSAIPYSIETFGHKMSSAIFF
jgi:peptidoglycan/xylan/chitin deacetylase (PgdA/CDA1 family)